MAYSKQTWDTTSVFNPTRMNHMEQGIEDASIFEQIDSIEYTETVNASTQTLVQVPNPQPNGYTLISAFVLINRVTGSWYIDAFYNAFTQTLKIRNDGTSANTITFVVRFLYKKV